MTTITLTHPDDADPDRPTNAGNGFVASFSEFRAGARDGREIYERYCKLSSMSNAELAELGLTRADIYRAALLGYPRHPPKPRD